MTRARNGIAAVCAAEPARPRRVDHLGPANDAGQRQPGAIGVVVGGLGGFAIARLATGYVEEAQLPGALPVIGSAAILSSAPPPPGACVSAFTSPQPHGAERLHEAR